MGAQFKFNPCGCCSTPFSGISTNCCDNVPSSFKGSLVGNIFNSKVINLNDTGVTGEYFVDGYLPYFEIKYDEHAGTAFFGGSTPSWPGGLRIGVSHQCGTMTNYNISCNNFSAYAGSCTGFKSNDDWPYTYSMSNPTWCNNCESENMEFDWFFSSGHRLNMDPMQYDGSVIPFESGCCPTLYDNTLHVWKIRDAGYNKYYSPTGTIERMGHSPIFSGTSLNENHYYYLECARNKSVSVLDNNAFAPWWFLKYGSTGVYEQAPSTSCYPFMPLFNSLYNAEQWLVFKYDNTTVSGIPTTFTDSRLIPRDLFLKIVPEQQLTSCHYSLPQYNDYKVTFDGTNKWLGQQNISSGGITCPGFIYLDLFFQTPYTSLNNKCYNTAFDVIFRRSDDPVCTSHIMSGVELVSLDPLLIRARTLSLGASCSQSGTVTFIEITE